MRQSKLFGKTSREVPRSSNNKSSEYLLRGGFIRESTAGRYYMLPLGMRVQDKIMAIIEEEMTRLGAQKMLTPTLHPIELWQETNRTNSAGFELTTVKDRRRAEFALGGTAEEMFVDLVRKFSISYKYLPFTLYQFSQKFRDELRARGGLLRVREFVMKDAYSFHVDEADFRREYDAFLEAYHRIFSRCGLNTLVAASDNGYIGGEYCHEFISPNPVGESRILTTSDGTYTAHEDVAVFARGNMNLDEALSEMQTAPAARGPSIADGVKFYGQPAWRQIKTIVYVTDSGEFIMVALRGDLEVNETKLGHVLGCRALQTATAEDIRRLGSEPGFVSPLKLSLKKIGDPSLRTVRNFSTGADEPGKDRLNVNYPRDFQVDIEADIAMARPGHSASNGQPLTELVGIEVGNIFQLGGHYSTRMKATFIDAGGQSRHYYMGCYGIGVGRTLAAIVEAHHDERGIIWPVSVAPFAVHLVSLAKKGTE
ncbi:MAG: proline--tRNA ligase, partial [Candidatus Magasanikbacteria bacterium]|nr:proline--tRNA ligase [Candidatus Magasanikbacteria bacterium]